MLKKAVMFLFIALVSLNGEEVIELNINNQDVEVKAQHEIFATGSDMETKYFVGGFVLNSNDKNDGTANLDDDKIYGIDFLLKNQVPSIPGLHASVGIKALSHDHLEDDFIALPVGIELAYELPLGSLPSTMIGAKYYYAPETLAFVDAKNYSEFRVELKMEIIKNAEIFIGYRTIDTDYAKYDFEFNSSIYAGIVFHIR